MGATETEGSWDPLRKPRIRQITGIRIHQLTLPDALAIASAHRHTGAHVAARQEAEGAAVVGSSHLSASPEASGSAPAAPALRRQHSSSSQTTSHPSRRERRASISQPPRLRQRSSSSSIATVSTLIPNRQSRVTRPRAPTLAGEAMEHHASRAAHSHPSGPIDEQKAAVEVQKRTLARSFVVFKMPVRPGALPAKEEKPRSRLDVAADNRSIRSFRSNGGERSPSGLSIKLPAEGPRSSRKAGSAPSLRQAPTAVSTGQVDASPVATSPTPHSASAAASLRAIQSSLMSSKRGQANGKAKAVADQAPAPTPEPVEAAKKCSDSTTSETKAPTSTVDRASRERADSVPMIREPNAVTEPPVPFFISSVHHPSTHPRWMHLSRESDFAPSMAVEDAASSEFEVEVWYEDDEKGWTRLEDLGRHVDLQYLQRLRDDDSLEDNILEFTLEGEKGIWYLPLPGHEQDSREQEQEDGSALAAAKRTRGQSVSGIVEKSLRETRMKKGTGIGSLQQLVNIQAVLADTQRSVETLQQNIDKLLAEDIDKRAFKRDLYERAYRCRWIRDAMASVDKAIQDVQGKTTQRESDVEDRRSCLLAAEEADEVIRGRAHDLQEEIESAESDRSALIPAIHHLRSIHAQTLDFIFPIQPLDASALLYSILDVPLPIPVGPRDPAPPLTLPPNASADGVKVDERTTAAALGYAALVVQLLGGLAGPTGGLPYPIMCAGSRSLVKDVVSVMQGPRAFPLFAKGVERYRYEYAVFLLNKNIETLAQDAQSRILDIRHTLPNLKSLLLTLSSPVPPEPVQPYSALASSSATYVNSRASSRYPSKSWAVPAHSPGSERSVADTVETYIGSPASRNATSDQQHGAKGYHVGIQERPRALSVRKGG